MSKKLLITFFLAQFTQLALAQSIERVIYVTLDGVRWQEVFKYREHFKILHEKHAQPWTVLWRARN